MCFVVEGYYCDDGIGTDARPGQLEGVLRACHFQNHIGPAVIGVGEDEFFAVLWVTDKDIWILYPDECIRAGSFSQTMTRLEFFRSTHIRVQRPVGPAPMISTVSSSVISEMRAAQKPVAKTSPTNKACSLATLS